jgi:pantetheine-phosphate adenylyltransferase
LLKAIFPGSFDPITLGHVDIIRRSAPMFGGLTVAILDKPTKTPLFDVSERMAMIREAVHDIGGVSVEAYDGLLAAYAKQAGARYIVRGVRSEADCAYEIPMALANRHLGDGLETILLISDPAYAHVSSGLMREAAMAGYASGFDDRLLDEWFPNGVKLMLRKKIQGVP